MSGWPWMRDVDPTSFINVETNDNHDDDDDDDDDARPLISQLIADHRTTIDQVRKELANDDLFHLYDKTKHDDLWVLRFLLSHNHDPDRAVVAARATMLYRKKYNLDAKDFRSLSPQMRFGSQHVTAYRTEIDRVKQLLSNDDLLHLYDETKHNDVWLLPFVLRNRKDSHAAAEEARTAMILEKQSSNNITNSNNNNTKDSKSKSRRVRFDENIHSTFLRFVNYGMKDDALIMVQPDVKRRGVVFYLTVSSIDTHELAELEQEDWNASMAYVNEFQFQWNDYMTRTTGRLTKAVHIVDVAGIGLDTYNGIAQEKYTTATKFLEDFYPQAVQAYLVCHAPIWIEAPWRILKPLLPTRVVSKLDFLNPNDYDQDYQKLLKFMPEHLLPLRFGGKYEGWPPAY